MDGDLKLRPRSTLSSRNLAGSCRSRRTVCGRMLSLATARDTRARSARTRRRAVVAPGLPGAAASWKLPHWGAVGAVGAPSEDTALTSSSSLSSTATDRRLRGDRSRQTAHGGGLGALCCGVERPDPSSLKGRCAGQAGGCRAAMDGRAPRALLRWNSRRQQQAEQNHRKHRPVDGRVT